MSIHDERNDRRLGESLAKSREEYLASAPLFPGHEAMLIEELTDEEAEGFLAALGV